QNVWSHVFVTYDGSSKAAGVKIYVNGQPAQVEVKENRLSDTMATSQPLRLGKRSTGFCLKGELADVRIYRRTLTAEEVQALAFRPLQEIIRTPAEKRTKPQQEFLAQTYRERYA